VCTIPVNLGGLPGLSIPCGFSSDGLPIGLQLVGPPLSEETMLRAAYAFEQSTDFHRRRAVPLEVKDGRRRAVRRAGHVGREFTSCPPQPQPNGGMQVC
jgi:hypothetical protein